MTLAAKRVPAVWLMGSIASSVKYVQLLGGAMAAIISCDSAFSLGRGH